MSAASRTATPATAFQAGRWTLLILLTLATTLNFVDRQLPFILIEHIRKDLRLSDTQIGLLGGIAFSLVYSLAALPLARLADSRSRKWLLAGCVTVWSLMTATGALAQNFLQLAFTRTGVAIAEAGCNPTAHAMIAERFGRRSGLALAVNTTGIPLGMMIGLGLGGWLVDRMSWQHVLLLAGVPGLLLAAAIAVLVGETPAAVGVAKPPTVSLVAAVKVLSRRTSFVWMAAGATLCGLAASGGAAFGAAFLMRQHHLSAGQAGLMFGLVLGVCGVAGNLASGVVGDWLANKHPGGRMYGAAAATLLMTPFYVLAWSAHDVTSWILLFAPAWLLLSFFLPMTYAGAQAVSATGMRATTSALLQLVLNLVGNVSGPILVGLLSDAWKPTQGVHALGLGLAVMGCAGVLAAGAYAMAGRAHGRDLAAARRAATTD